MYPAFATQAVAAVAPDKPPVAELSGQSVQAPFPVAALNVATGQAVQDVLVPSGPMYPAEHMPQSVTAVEPVVVVDLPVGHAVGVSPLAP